MHSLARSRASVGAVVACAVHPCIALGIRVCPPLLLWGEAPALVLHSSAGIIETSMQTDILHLRTSADSDETDSTAKQW
jgi:hypothetical protein